MHILLVSVVVATCSALVGCGKGDDFKPAVVQGMEVPAEWGTARRDFAENREGGDGVTVKSVLDAEIARYKGWTPGVQVESTTDSSAVLVLDATDLRRGKETAAGLPADPQIAAMPPDRMRVLVEVRTNGPVFVVRTREFGIADEPAREKPVTGG